MRVDLKTLVKQNSFLTESTVYRMAAQRAIPHYKIGRKLVFETKEIEEWIESKKVKTQEEIQREVATRVLTRK